MASHKSDTSSESKKKAEVDSKHTAPPKEQEASKGDLSELLEEVEEMYKIFLVSPKVVCKDPESKETQPWRSRRLDSKKAQNSGSSVTGEESPWPPRQPAAPAKVPRASRSIAKLPDFQPERQQSDNLSQRMRKILHNPTYKSGDRLSPEDEVKVRSVFQYHPKAEEKTGPGIDYIKIDRVYDEHTRCFWVVRIDGTAIDFSYHKCLKARAARECPGLVEHHGSIYMDY